MMGNRSSKALSDFFSTLLEEPSDKPHQMLESVVKKPLEQLLARVSEAAPDIELTNIVAENNKVLAPQNDPVVITETVSTTETQSALTRNTLQQQLTGSFPVLYFKSMNLTLAVPLIKLKAIYPLQKVTKLIGKPSWYLGIQTERGQNINVIDTAKYLMAEKYQSALEQSVNYKYIIVLEDSNWGLLCEELIDSSSLTPDDIKWRTGVLLSPWLAGTVKQRMCGLLAVDALTELLNNNSSISVSTKNRGNVL
ncbi:MAG: chemotaxis protein CheW [Gammaproteobacteria bacterium]|nr:chemotaxis protein CheW [Gammaproteobacteria bacterium]